MLKPFRTVYYFKKKITNIIHNFFSYNYFKTLYFNYRVFPFEIARKLPIQIGWNVDLFNINYGNISFHSNIKIHKYMVKIGITPYPMWSNKRRYTMLRFSKNSKLILGSNIRIHTGSSIITSYSSILSIGSDIIMNQDSFIYAAKSVTIGNHCRIGWGSQIYDSNFHFIYNLYNQTIASPFNKVTIGNNVWIGNKSTISKGAYIPSFTIVASNSLFNKDFSHLNNKGNFFAGIPCKLINNVSLLRIFNEKTEKELFKTFLKEDLKYIKYDQDPTNLFFNT